MELYEAIEKRRMCRHFTDQDVDFSVIERILGAAIKAPTNNHLRQWQFVVLRTEEEKERVLQYVKEFADGHKDMEIWPGETDDARVMYSYAIPRQYSMLTECPYVVIPFFKAPPMMSEAGPVNTRNTLAGAWCMIENIFLASSAEGLACSVRIPVGSEGEKVAELTGAPDGWLATCYIGIGHPAEDDAGIVQPRPLLSEIMHRGKW